MSFPSRLPRAWPAPTLLQRCFNQSWWHDQLEWKKWNIQQQQKTPTNMKNMQNLQKQKIQFLSMHWQKLAQHTKKSCRNQPAKSAVFNKYALTSHKGPVLPFGTEYLTINEISSCALPRHCFRLKSPGWLVTFLISLQYQGIVPCHPLSSTMGWNVPNFRI